MSWNPVLDDEAPTLSGRLLAALRRDIERGRLTPGTRLPPHRDLAHRLGIGIGTVTSVYGEAMRQGLLTATVGRGSFVADNRPPSARDDGPIGMSRNLPPLIFAQRRLGPTLAALGKRGDIADLADYAPPAGHEPHRRSAARWLSRVSGLVDVRADRLVITAGAQQAMSLVLDILCRRGDAIMTEGATYFGIRSIAQVGGYRTIGLTMDEEGLLPEAFDRAAASGAKLLYTSPTLQNPTGRIMGDRRRSEIAAIARRHGVWIVEDDLYSAFAQGTAPPPLAAYAPERCFYINGTSKALAPGLRTGFLVVPDDDMLDRVLRRIRAQMYAPPAMGAMIGSMWMEDGTADEIVGEIRAEVLARGRMAAERLGAALSPPADPHCPHLWLPMSELDAERLAARALRAGVEVTTPSALLVDPSSISGVRLCVGTASDRTQLGVALDRVVTALGAGRAEVAEAVI